MGKLPEQGPKWCRGCNQGEGVVGFEAARRTKCRNCRYRDDRKLVSVNPDRQLKLKIRDAAWSLKNPEKRKEIGRRFRENNPEKFTSYQRKSYQKHRDIRIKRAKEWKQKNKPRIRIKALEYYWRDPVASRKKARDTAQARYKRNPEKFKASQAKYRSHLKMYESTLTNVEWLAIKERAKGRCEYCHKRTKKFTMDHLTPVSKGGTHTANNIAAVCQSCNSKKKTGPILAPIQLLMLG